MSILSYTATPLSEPRLIPSSPYRNTQVNHEIKCESDHTFPKQRQPAGIKLSICTNIQNGQRNQSTQECSAYHGISRNTSNEFSHTSRRTLPSPQLSPTFTRRQKTISGNQRQHEAIPVYLPKALRNDGATNWEAFFVKFNKYADASHLTTTDRQNQLCWCSDGKASDFYTTIVSRD